MTIHLLAATGAGSACGNARDGDIVSSIRERADCPFCSQMAELYNLVDLDMYRRRKALR